MTDESSEFPSDTDSDAEIEDNLNHNDEPSTEPEYDVVDSEQ